MFVGQDGLPKTKLSWTAPTLNTDGSAITQSLTYTLYRHNNDVILSVLSFPGTLNPDGQYEFLLEDIASFNTDGVYTLSLTATDEDGDESDHSNTIEVTRAMAPLAPTGFGLV
jgi:hypothetical protein